MEYSVSTTPIKYHSTVIISLILLFKMSLQCVNNNQDIQILQLVKKLGVRQNEREKFFSWEQIPPLAPLPPSLDISCWKRVITILIQNCPNS